MQTSEMRTMMQNRGILGRLKAIVLCYGALALFV